MPDFWLWDDQARDRHEHGAVHDERGGGDQIRWLLDDLLHARRVEWALNAAHTFVGNETYAAGFYYGLGLAAAEAATGMAHLARTFVLADVYEVLVRDSAKAHVLRSFNYGAIKLAARLIRRDSGTYHLLEAEYERREALIAEVRKLLEWDALRSLPTHLRAEYHEKWRQIEALNRRSDLADRFQAGKYFGKVVGELVLTIGGLLELGVVTVELAARAPTLIKLARGMLKNAADDVAKARVPKLSPAEAPKPVEAQQPTKPPKQIEPASVAPVPEPYSAPPLTETGGREMFREARANLMKAPPEQRADIFDQYRAQMTERSKGQWNARRIDASNGTMYSGEGGEAIAFDKAGNMYRGPAGRQTLGYKPGEGLTIIFDNMKPQ
jgi:hypothetical protein